MITADQTPAELAQPLQALRTPALMPATVTAPVDAEPTTPSPITGQLQPPSVQALSGNATPPVRFGHFQKALMDGANEAAASDPNANEPGSWARHLIAGAGKALSGGTTALGDVSTKPGGSVVAGIAETLANRNQRLTQQKEYNDKQAQLAKENERQDQTLALEKQKADDLHAYNMIQTLNLQKGMRNLDKEFQESQVKSDSTVADMLRQAHRQELTPVGGISESEYEQNFGTGKKYDPSKTQPLHTGWTTVTKDGKEEVEPTWSIFSREANQSVPVDKAGAAILANGPPATRFKEGDTVDGDVLYNAIRQVGAAAVTEKNINNALDSLDEEHMTAEKKKANASDLATVGPYLGGNDFLTDVQKMTKHVGKDGKPAPEAQAAQRLLTNFFTPEQLETHRKNLADEAIRKEEADFKNAAKNEFNGDTTKIGLFDDKGVNRAYLSSLKPDEQALVMAAGSGQLGIERWDYLLSHTPEFAAAVANTFHNFDSSKIKDYIAVSKDFTQGGTFNSLNSAGAMSQHLKDLWDKSTYSAMAPFSVTEDAARRKAIVGQLAPESIKFFSGTKAKPGEQETAEEASKYDDYANRRTYIQQKAENAVKKLNEFKQSWANAAPSEIYQAQMPWISPQAQHDLAYILNNGKEPSPEQVAALGPGTLPPGGLNQTNTPAFKQPTAPPAGIPQHAVIVPVGPNGTEYYADPVTKKLIAPVVAQTGNQNTDQQILEINKRGTAKQGAK